MDMLNEGEAESTTKEKREEIYSPLSELSKQLEKESTAENKIRVCLDFMRLSLLHSGTPRFKDFWEGRKICLPLFKETVSPKVRSAFWNEYVELSNEAKRVKEILDEQSAFAVEQIELAIQALERDLEHYDLTVSQSPDLSLGLENLSLKEKAEIYEQIQKELSVLNVLASRVNAMRKEVVKTEMRVRIKNKLLDRLSVCGDKIFPRRKELVKEISQMFSSDIEEFIAFHFQENEIKKIPLYILREEIKELQAIAKILTLNTHTFTQTRLALSRAWDQLKELDRERKQETLQKRQIFKQNYDLVLEKIKELADACSKEISVEDCQKLSSEIFDFMRTVELGRDEVRALKEEIQKAKNPSLERARQAEEERQRLAQEAENLRREKIQGLKEGLGDLLSEATDLDVDALCAKRDALLQTSVQLMLNKAEKQISDRLFRQLKDVIDEKKQKALLMLSEEDQKAFDQLKAAVDEKKKQRAEIKNQLEHYRKQLGNSGFDFEKAMQIREFIETEKEALERLNTSIAEIEERIDEIEA